MPKARFDWNETTEKQLRKLWRNSGLTASMIAKQMDCGMGLLTRSAVCGKAQRMGLSKPAVHVVRDWEADGLVDQLRGLLEKGLTAAAISREMSIPITTVRQRVKLLGIDYLSIRKDVQGRVNSVPLPTSGSKYKLAGNNHVFAEAKAQAANATISGKAWQPLPTSNPKRLEDRSRGECVWPLDGGVFCCGPCNHEDSYCTTHRMMATVVRKAA